MRFPLPLLRASLLPPPRVESNNCVGISEYFTSFAGASSSFPTKIRGLHGIIRGLHPLHGRPIAFPSFLCRYLRIALLFRIVHRGQSPLQDRLPFFFLYPFWEHRSRNALKLIRHTGPRLPVGLETGRTSHQGRARDAGASRDAHWGRQGRGIWPRLNHCWPMPRTTLWRTRTRARLPIFPARRRILLRMHLPQLGTQVRPNIAKPCLRGIYFGALHAFLTPSLSRAKPRHLPVAPAPSISSIEAGHLRRGALFLP